MRRNKKIRQLVLAAVIVITAFVMAIAAPKSVAAESSYDRGLITTKAMLQGLRFLVEYGDADDADPKYFSSFDSLDKFQTANDLINTKSTYASSSQTSPLPGGNGDNSAYHGSLNKDSDSTPRIVLNDIITGNSSIESVFSRTKKYVFSQVPTWQNIILEKTLFYDKTPGKTTKSCWKYKIPVTYNGALVELKNGGWSMTDNNVWDDSWTATADRYTAKICADADSNTGVISGISIIGTDYDKDYSWGATWRGGSYGMDMSSMWSWNNIVGKNVDGTTTPTNVSKQNKKGEDVFEVDESSKTLAVSEGMSISYANKTIEDFQNEIISTLNTGYSTRVAATATSSFVSDYSLKPTGQLLFAPFTCKQGATNPIAAKTYYEGMKIAVCYYGSTFVREVLTGPATMVVTDESITDGTYSPPKSTSKYKVLAAFTDYTGGYLDNDSVKTWALQHAYLTKSEQISLYADYLQSAGFIDGRVRCDVDGSSGAYGDPIKWFEPGNTALTQNCYVTNQQNGSKKFNAVIDVGVTEYPMTQKKYAGSFIGAGKIDMQGLMEFFRTLPDATKLDYPSVATSSPSSSDSDGDGSGLADKERTCYDSAGSSNWIACPIIENSKDTSTRLYGFIENMLQTNTEIFNLGNDNTGKGNGTFVAWSKFRDYANIFFIIIFAVVILSQVTGLGIDNYGVKKILPKIILGAILVNVSYFVCQASVDVGNITGGGIKRLFDGILNDIGLSDAKIYASFDGVKDAQGLIVGSAAGILAAVIFAAYKLSGGGIVVALILAAIGVVIGIFFLLVLLAVRQGLAVILVTISPLAFIAYMLPNTKSLFNKWLKLLSGTLLAYPICSLVVYGGQMVSNIILMAAASDGVVSNFALLITSAILSIAPVFFIPSLIMKSMSGIATVANGLKARATSLGKSAFDRSNTADTMRNVAAAKRENMAVNRARKTKAALEEKQKNGSKLSIGERARLRTAQNAIAGLDRKNYDLYSGMAKGKNKKELSEMGEEAFEDGGYDAEKFDAAVAQLFATGNDEEAFDLIKKMSKNVGSLNTEQLEKFKTTLATKGGTIGKAYAKVLGKNGSGQTATGDSLDLDTAMRGGAKGLMGGAIKDLGKNALAGMSKDEMGFLSNNFAGEIANGLFSDDQYAEAVATHNSGSVAEKLNKLIESSGQASAIKSQLSAEQWAKANEKTLEELGFSDVDNDSRAKQIMESGDGSLISSISGESQQAAMKRLSDAKKAADDAKAAAQAARVKEELKARDSQQRFQQGMVQAINKIQENMKKPPETFSDGGGI